MSVIYPKGATTVETILGSHKEFAKALEEDMSMKTVLMQGIKHDQGKPDLSLLPVEFLNEVAFAMMYGETKYGRYNFTGGMAWHRLIAACLRHVYAFAAREELDKESGVSHLGHAAACLLMLTVYQSRNLGTDTREIR